MHWQRHEGNKVNAAKLRRGDTRHGGQRRIVTEFVSQIRQLWWRRGESEYSRLLKTRKLLKNRDAQKSKNAGIAPNWNISGTRLAKKRSGAAAEWRQLLNQRCGR